jgi:hypothetical protein
MPEALARDPSSFPFSSIPPVPGRVLVGFRYQSFSGITLDCSHCPYNCIKASLWQHTCSDSVESLGAKNLYLVLFKPLADYCVPV